MEYIWFLVPSVAENIMASSAPFISFWQPLGHAMVLGPRRHKSPSPHKMATFRVFCVPFIVSLLSLKMLGGHTVKLS